MLRVAVSDISRLFGLEPEVYIGENVPGSVIAMSHPRRILVLDRRVLAESEASRRFALGWAFDAIAGGYASLLQLGQKQRNELAQLLQSMFLPESERSAPTNEFIGTLPVTAIEILRCNEGRFQDMDMQEWIDDMNAVARRAGLLACDDLPASARMLAVISGEDAAEQYSALGTVFCGEDLFQFFVSDDYDQLRESLSRVPTMAP
jgi:hypothetical protein